MNVLLAVKSAAWLGAAVAMFAATPSLADTASDATPSPSCTLDMSRFPNPAGITVHPEADPARLTWSRRHAHLFNVTKTTGYAVVAMTLQTEGRVAEAELAEHCSTTEVDLGRVALGAAAGTRWAADDGRSLEGVTIYHAYQYPQN